MSISSVNGATPQEPQKPESKGVNEQDGKFYSIFDNAPQDGTVSTEEQKTAFINSANNDSSLVKMCKQYKINFADFFKSFGALFTNIETDGTEQSATEADEEIKQRILKVKMEALDKILAKMGGEDEAPSVTTKEGIMSQECLDYFVSKIVYMGLEMDTDVMMKVFREYDYDLNGEDSVITPDELNNNGGNPIYMSHDFEGGIIDTHALDYLVNKYAEALENRE